MENNSQERIATYFAAIEAQLEALPAARRAEFIDEARAHLHAMVEAKRADGLSEAGAWNAAMTEFGEPTQVGRALHEQWADSAQLESEGVPLSRAEVARKFALPVAAALGGFIAFMLLITPAMWHSARAAPMYTLALASLIGVGIWRGRKQGGQWTPSNVMIAAVTAVILIHVIAGLDWGTGRYPLGIARVIQPMLMPLILVECVLWVWLRRRERADRPWQWSARFKQNPVAAEQEYRLYPLIGLAMGTALGCVGMIGMGLQFFGLPLALLSCGGLIGVAVVFGWWLWK